MHAKTKLGRFILTGLAGLMASSLAFGFTFIVNTDANSGGLPVKWPAGTIPVLVMADNSTKLSDGSTRATAIVAAMQDAQRGWNQNLGDEQFAPQIMPAGDGKDGDSINQVFFSSSPYSYKWDANTLAVTTEWAQGNQRVEADTIFNTAFTWDSYRGALHSGVEDIQRVALHELGHNLGLDHPDEATPPQTVTAIMNSHVSAVDGLQTDDIAGAQSLYGPPGAPANDNFANAIDITLGSDNTASISGYNTNATKETNEPKHADNIGGRSIWWKWTAPSAGSMTIDTKGSYCDTTLAVYTGTSVSALTAIASNDDLKLPTTADPTHIQASLVTFSPTPGTTYYIAVDGFNNSDGLGADSSAIKLNLDLTASGGSIPVITAQPVSQTVTAGNVASFSVTATDASTDGPLTYQWLFNGTAITGATSNPFSIGNAQAVNAGTYAVTVTNKVGSVTSANVSLTVNPAPVVTPPKSGGGGGGAPSLWFCAALSLLGMGRRLFRARR